MTSGRTANPPVRGVAVGPPGSRAETRLCSAHLKLDSGPELDADAQSAAVPSISPRRVSYSSRLDLTDSFPKGFPLLVSAPSLRACLWRVHTLLGGSRLLTTHSWGLPGGLTPSGPCWVPAQRSCPMPASLGIWYLRGSGCPFEE